MGQMTRLQAVNKMLLAAGEAIVADLDNQSGVDTSIAEFILDEFTSDFQMRGLANNEYPEKLTIGEDGRILLPTTIISLDFLTLLMNPEGVAVRVSIKRQGDTFLLFNVTDQTLDWTAYADQADLLMAKFIVEIPWEDIDTPGQRAVVAQASRRYQMLTQGDGAMDAYLQQDEQIYTFKGKARDMESKHRNIWDASSYQTKRAVFRPPGGAVNARYWRHRDN
jgi:hypothetical protein